MADASLRASGIYAIRNTVNGKVYVGSAARLHRRLSEHRRKLLLGTHENDRLQKAFTKYGADAFDFSVLEYAQGREQLLAREQHWIDHFDCAKRDVGYNIYPTAGSPVGTRHTEDARRKMREAAKRRQPICDETRARLSAALKGRVIKPESIEKQRRSLTGYKHSAETREKVSAAGKGRKRSVEATAKIAAAHRGMKRSAEARAKMSAKAKLRGFPAAARVAQLAAVTGRKCSDEERARRSAAALAMWAKRKAQALEEK